MNKWKEMCLQYCLQSSKFVETLGKMSQEDLTILDTLDGKYFTSLL